MATNNKPKRAAAAKTVNIYNHTTGAIGVHLPGRVQGHPPRSVRLLPGNNDNIPHEDWELMQKNATFMVNFTERMLPTITGKREKRTNLELGKTDPGQAAEEADLQAKIDKAREERQAGAA